MNPETVFIGFGGNLGDRHEYCDRALNLMKLLPHSRFLDVSSYYETEPVDPNGTLGNTWFYNGVIRLETHMAPHSLLDILQETERALGRSGMDPCGPRTMDFDILFYGQHTLSQPGLTIPHPRLQLRRFVLAPLAELDQDWMHPLLNMSVKELLACVEDTTQVRKLPLIPGSRVHGLPPGSPPF